MALFGYTNPDFLNKYQEEVKDGEKAYGISWLRATENFKETKDKFCEYPYVNKTTFPTEYNDFTINDIAKQFQPVMRINNSFYNGVPNEEKSYLYGQQIYIPESYPNNFINTNKFSPLYIAMNKHEKEQIY